jgi:hypothetical protein
VNQFLIDEIKSQNYKWYTDRGLLESWAKTFNNVRSRHKSKVREEEDRLIAAIGDIDRANSVIGHKYELGVKQKTDWRKNRGKVTTVSDSDDEEMDEMPNKDEKAKKAKEKDEKAKRKASTSKASTSKN